MNRLLEEVARIVSQLRAELQTRVGDELARSDRAKVLLAAVVGILLLSLTIACGTMASTAQREYRAAQVAFARLKAQVNTGSWAERRAQSQALKLTIEERFWVANTPGLAEAGFDRWIRDHLGRYKVEPQAVQMRRVAVATGPADAQRRDPLANVERMTAKILMPFDQTGLLGFLDDIAESDKTIVIDRLIVRAGRNARVEIDVSTFYPAREKVR